MNLTPEQLEQLKRNGQLTVNGQTIYMQRPNKSAAAVVENNHENKNKLSPKTKTAPKKVNNAHAKPPVPPEAAKNAVDKEGKTGTATPKHILPQQKPAENQKAKPQTTTKAVRQNETVIQNNGATQDVERILGQLLEEGGPTTTTTTNGNAAAAAQQRVHTIQLTPEKQQHLKSIQGQIQAISQRLVPGDTETHNTLKMLFGEQQKILATGKLLPPAIYHNNQLTIVSPSTLNLPANVCHQQKTETHRNACNDVGTVHHVSSHAECYKGILTLFYNKMTGHSYG